MIARHESPNCGCPLCRLADAASGERTLVLSAAEAETLAFEIDRLTVMARHYASRALKAEARIEELEEQAALASPTVAVH